MPTSSTTPPQPWKAGEPISAAKLNASFDGAIANITAGNGLTISRSGRNVAVGIDPKGGLGTIVMPVKITSMISAQVGRYNAKRIAMQPKSDASGKLTETDVGTLSTADDCVIWHVPEIAIGSAKHLLKTGATYMGRVAGVTSDAKWIVLIGVLPIGDTTSPKDLTTGSGATADTTAWNRSSDGCAFTRRVQTRTFLDTGAHKLYGFYRDETYDACGLLTNVTAETRYEIDTTTSC